MLDKKIQQALNDQLNAELYSAYLYLSMAAYFHSTNLPGFANWMTIQAQEEQMHAMKFYDYLNQRGGRVILTTINTPPGEWSTPLEVFEAVYAHEQKVTYLINGLMDLALQQKDHAACAFLQWFVSEQVEEESSADELVQKLKLIKNNTAELFTFDRELARRVFTPPAAKGGE
jgi:ferritin